MNLVERILTAHTEHYRHTAIEAGRADGLAIGERRNSAPISSLPRLSDMLFGRRESDRAERLPLVIAASAYAGLVIVFIVRALMEVL